MVNAPSTFPTAMATQALALWQVDVLPYQKHTHQMDLTYAEFRAAIHEARITLNAIAADRKLTARVFKAVQEAKRPRGRSAAA